MYTQTPELSPVSCIPLPRAQLYRDLFVAKYPALAERANGRTERAVEICHRPGACRRTDHVGVFLVEASNPDHQPEIRQKKYYEVDVNRHTCTCPDSSQGNVCKHRLAIGFHLFGSDWSAEAEKNRVSQQYEARRAYKEAWRVQLEAATDFEALASNGVSSENTIAAARQMALELTTKAVAAQARYEELCQPGPDYTKFVTVVR